MKDFCREDVVLFKDCENNDVVVVKMDDGLVGSHFMLSKYVGGTSVLTGFEAHWKTGLPIGVCS